MMGRSDRADIMVKLTQQAAEFAAALTFDDLPATAVKTIGFGLADCVAVIAAGQSEPVVHLLGEIEGSQPSGEAAILFGQRFARADIAALINSAAAHALDFDDTGLSGHPSAVLVPAILALGEATAADGKRMLSAYVAGYEIWADLIGRQLDPLHAKGLHPTAIFGPIATAAATCNLLSLDSSQTRSALSLAASMSSGIVANFGSLAKHLQVGRAVQNGIQAARYAARGVTAAADGLENPLGFLKAFAPAGRVDLEREPSFGDSWAIEREGLNIKLHPVCHAAQRSIDAALDLRERFGQTADAIEKLQIHIGRGQASALRFSRPKDALEARFSAEFVVASALLTGKVSLADLNDDYIRSNEIQSLIGRSELILSDELDGEEPLFAPADHVVLYTTSGERLESAPIRRARGHARNPVTTDILREKFHSCAAFANREAADELFDYLIDPAGIDSVPAINAMYRRASAVMN
jgi:2-methylcitrate dehydratase PrpD